LGKKEKVLFAHLRTSNHEGVEKGEYWYLHRKTENGKKEKKYKGGEGKGPGEGMWDSTQGEKG